MALVAESTPQNGTLPDITTWRSMTQEIRISIVNIKTYDTFKTWQPAINGGKCVGNG